MALTSVAKRGISYEDVLLKAPAELGAWWTPPLRIYRSEHALTTFAGLNSFDGY